MQVCHTLALLTLLAAAVGCPRDFSSDSEREDARPVDSGVGDASRRDADERALDVSVLPSRDADEESSLEPATWEQVLPLVRIGDDGPALAALERLSPEERASPGARYLRGRLLERLNRQDEAAEAFELDELPYPRGITKDIQRRRALALARAGRCVDARPQLEKEGRQAGTNGMEARLLAARCALELGELEAAVRELRALKARGGRDVDFWSVRFTLAEALAKSGSAPEAGEVLRELVVIRPEHSAVPQAEALLRELGEERDLTLAERLRRTERLMKHRRFQAALDEINATKRPTRPGLLGRWLHLRGMALYSTRHDYAEAAKALAESARYGGPNAIEDEFHAARALSRADSDDEAIAAYLEFVKAHPNHARAAKAEYLAAWLDIRHERVRGERRMLAFLKGPRAGRDAELKRDATWQLAFRAFERGHFKRALPLFESYARMGRRGLIRGRGLYWRSRTLEAQGRRDEAVASYRQTIDVEPLHWYALLARDRLVVLGEDPGLPFKTATAASAPAPLPALRLPAEVAFYLSTGLDEDALRELQLRERVVLAAVPRGRETEALVGAYHKVGGYRRAYRMVASRTRDLDSRPGPGNRWVWHAAYPRPHASLVVRTAREQGVEAAHVYGTMRQESGYAPRVVSRADAIGLLQMLPATAKVLAKELDVPFRRELLFDPAWNIRFGIAEISGLHRTFDKRLPLTIAAYNAGPRRVRRWLKETGEIELDRFVERIPFDETRNYVRRVTSHYARYRYLEDPSRPWPVALPQKVGPLVEAEEGQ